MPLVGKSLAGDWDTGTAAQTQLPSLRRLLRPVTAVYTQVTQTHTLEWPQSVRLRGLSGRGSEDPAACPLAVPCRDPWSPAKLPKSASLPPPLPASWRLTIIIW